MLGYDTDSDQELARLLRGGDVNAFRAIYDRYWDKLYTVAAKRLNDSSEAEEVVQDIFLNLWKRREIFELKKGFDNYLAVATKFEVYKRRALRARSELVGETIKLTSNAYYAEDNNLYDLQALKLKINSAIESLPPKCKLIFTMSRNTELTNSQIATKMNVSEKAVEKHITNALRKLKVKLGADLIIFLIIFVNF